MGWPGSKENVKEPINKEDVKNTCKELGKKITDIKMKQEDIWLHAKKEFEKGNKVKAECLTKRWLLYRKYTNDAESIHRELQKTSLLFNLIYI